MKNNNNKNKKKLNQNETTNEIKLESELNMRPILLFKKKLYETTPNFKFNVLYALNFGHPS